MKHNTPRRRYEETVDAVDKKIPPAGALESALYAVLTNGTPVEEKVKYAYELFLNEEHRAVLDAFLLSDAPHDVVSRVLSIPSDVLSAYSYLFFDSTMFRNRLEKISYASSYDGNAYAKELLRTGVMVGSDYLVWTYGGKEEVDARRVVRHTMVDSFFRGMSHKGNSLTSNVTREAQKWWATAIKNAEILERIDPRATKQAYEELKIALEGVDETTSADKSPVPLEDILH